MQKQLFFLFILAATFVGCSPLSKFAHKTDVDYANTITQEELKELLTTYASDEFAGRNTGESGAEMAVNFLANNYESMGAKSPSNSFTQDVHLVEYKKPTASVSIGEQSYTIGKDFVSFGSVVDTTFSSEEVVYVNYGIEQEGYSNYESVDLRNKIVAMRIGEPMVNDSTYLFSGSTEPSAWSSWQGTTMRTELAKEKGAKAILLFVGDQIYPSLQEYYDHSSGSMKLKQDTLSTFYNLYVSPTMQQSVMADYAENGEFKLNESFDFSYENTQTPIVAQNVLAHVKGSEFPDEYIVLSAHLDHVGTNAEGEIYNGADDDGSGTVAILEIAEAFQQAANEGNGPKRSILFLHVTAEEKGLLGSRYYTDVEPIVPLENTVADLNIDMIGRTDPKREGNRNYVYLIGSDKLSTELHQLSEQVNAEHAQVELDYTYNAEDDPNRFYYRSDHYNFAKNNIPVIFYFNGTHDDYHQPSDTVDKIEFDLLENRARLIFYTAWELANRDNRIIVDKEFE